MSACLFSITVTINELKKKLLAKMWQRKGLVKVGNTGIQAIYGAQAAGFKAQINAKLGK